MSATINPDIVTDGLVLCLDASNSDSYSAGSNICYDLSGNNNHGTLLNGVAFNSQNRGSLFFDGVNDYIEIPDSDSLKIMESNLSCFAWVKPSKNITTAANIVARRNGSNIGGYIIHNTGTNILQCYIYTTTGGWQAVNASNVYVPNQWVYVGFTFDGSFMRLYKNGFLLQSPSSINGSTINPVVSTTRIGANAGTSQQWPGDISIVQIYNTTLSDTNILDNYQATKGRYGL